MSICVYVTSDQRQLTPAVEDVLRAVHLADKQKLMHYPNVCKFGKRRTRLSTGYDCGRRKTSILPALNLLS